MAGAEDFYKIFSLSIREVLRGLSLDLEQLQEIRLRTSSPLIIRYKNEEYFVGKYGGISKQPKGAYQVTNSELRETMEYISNYSLYAYEDEIRQGFLTIQGGHRIGLAGKVIMEQGKIKSMKYISFINVRLSHQIKGCADDVMTYIRDGEEIHHTLILSPPRCGKTTLLRDVVRQLSNGDAAHKGLAVGVVDERSEIGACYLGVPQNDLGIRTDVLDCCPKAQGMMMLIRTMSPQVIAVDEIGTREDIEALEYAMNCGCRILATVHGASVEELRLKPMFSELMKRHMFERYIVLGARKHPGEVTSIFDSHGSYVYRTSGEGCTA